MNRRGEKHIGAGREKSPSFTKITRETNKNNGEQIIVIKFICIWTINRKVYTYLENQASSTLKLRQ